MGAPGARRRFRINQCEQGMKGQRERQPRIAKGDVLTRQRCCHAPLTPCLTVLERTQPVGTDGGFLGREAGHRDGSKGKEEGCDGGYGSVCWEAPCPGAASLQ